MDLIERGQNQNRHPWELSRTKCIINQLKHLKINGNILDIGCGDCFFDKQLIKINDEIKIYGVDIFLDDSELISNNRLKTYNNLENLPNIKFDCIIMMDVLEHIEKDAEYLTSIVNRLTKNGTVLITVPAYQKLYSLHDEELKHFRRYNHKELSKVLRKAELKEKRWSYFYLSLIIGRLLTKNKTENLSSWEKSQNSFATKLVCFVLNVDFAVLNAFSKIGVHMPGLSLMTICRKQE